jgi:hypothetical protein
MEGRMECWNDGKKKGSSTQGAVDIDVWYSTSGRSRWHQVVKK